jgi:response regulator NasT
VQAIMDVAVARFNEFKALKDELISLQGELEERKYVERAKRILIKNKGATEEQAYSSMRNMAMNKNIKIVDVARNIIDVFEII